MKTGRRLLYFCMEYGLNHIVRLYSGGLGILAGDYLKEQATPVWIWWV